MTSYPRFDQSKAVFPIDPLKMESQVPISLDCVFDASLVPETCLEFPSLPV
jgi:hypothetical protein